MENENQICECGHSKFSHEEWGFVGACLGCIPARKCKKFKLQKDEDK